MTLACGLQPPKGTFKELKRNRLIARISCANPSQEIKS